MDGATQVRTLSLVFGTLAAALAVLAAWLYQRERRMAAGIRRKTLVRRDRMSP